MGRAKRARKKLKVDTTTQVLVRSARRCPLCFALDGDSRQKQGQIAHLDKNSDNNDLTNLQFLCLPHHDQYDSTTSQSKGFTKAEVRSYASLLDEYVEKMRDNAWPDALPAQHDPVEPNETIERCSVAAYHMRLPAYRAVSQFINQIVASAEVSLDDLLEFAKATSEVLFLYDQSTDAFVQEVYSNAVRLRSVGQRLEHLRKTRQPLPDNLVETESNLLYWFSGSVETWRLYVRPYLHIRDDAN